MFRTTFVFLLAAMVTALSLQGQMVNTTKGGVKSGKKIEAQDKKTPKVKEPSLADFGITPRSIVVRKTLSGGSFVTLREMTLTRIHPGAETPGPMSVKYPKTLWMDGKKELPVYQIDSREYFSEGLVRPTSHMRMKGDGKLEMTLDQGKTWTEGVRGDDGSWAFATPGDLFTLRNADEKCTPTVFAAWGIERGVTVKIPISTGGFGLSEAPHFASIAIAVAYGKNECAGLIKCIGGDWVIPFRGAKLGDLWVGGTAKHEKFMGRMAMKQIPAWRSQGSGAGLVDRPLWVMITKTEILIGISESPDIGHPDSMVDSFRTVAAFPLTEAKVLPKLAEAYKDHFGQNFWSRDDGANSYSQAADKAFVDAGLTTYLYPPIKDYVGTNQDVVKAATELWNQMSKRVKALGGAVAPAPIPSF